MTPLLHPSKSSPDTLFIRTKYINFGVQGNRESKQKDKVKKRYDFDDDESFDKNSEEFVNIENDA